MSRGVCVTGTWREPADGHALFYRFWRAAPERALLVLVHGFGEHGGRYEPVAHALVTQGISVAVPDLRGHGRSEGPRGDSPAVQRYMDDCELMTQQVFLPASGQARYAVYGHSFGGLLAILWALKGPAALRRAAIQSPLLEAGFPLPRMKAAAARVMAVVWPAFAFRLNLDADALSRDPSVAQAYRADPLVHNVMTARVYRSILRARDEALAKAAAIRVPSMLLCGTGDRIISVPHALQWYERMTCQKQVKTFPGSYHELHHEAVRDEVMTCVRDWTLADD